MASDHVPAPRLPKIIIIAVYFGRLPAYFPLWLKSCAHNSEFNWLVITDCDVSSLDPVPNVEFQHMTLEKFSNEMSETLGIDIALRNAYKVCDFRPLFWKLLAERSDLYEFWGHCDIDLIFGDLRSFINARWFDVYDKIFSVGHLTLYRNCDLANLMYAKPHPKLDWRTILADPRHRGFDEHVGVNRIWDFQGGKVIRGESLIADIDPHVYRFETTRRNYYLQVFYYENGRVHRGYYKNSKWCVEEFMYIHMQKRRFDFEVLAPGVNRYYITSRGFIAKNPGIPSIDEVRRLNYDGWSLSNRELAYKLRRRLRDVRRRFIPDEMMP